MEFLSFNKIPRLSRECVITEKIDGTNASVYIVDLADNAVMPTDTPIVAVAGTGNPGFQTRLIYAGSRTRWITPKDDNYGFAKWVETNSGELAKLGPGHHFGEWWGAGIQRGYGLQKGDKRFSLFNTSIWRLENTPACCSVVPVLFTGIFNSWAVDSAISLLAANGSQAAPGFTRPEGIVVYHTAAGCYFKKTLEKDEAPKMSQAMFCPGELGRE